MSNTNHKIPTNCPTKPFRIRSEKPKSSKLTTHYQLTTSTMPTLTKSLFLSLLPLSVLTLLFLFSRTTLNAYNHRHFSHLTHLKNPLPSPPKIAYFITGSNGDVSRIFRLLLATYHPNNHYLLHLDQRASIRQRHELAVLIESVEAFVNAGNVNVFGKPHAVNNQGSTPLALVLHGAAALLRCCGDWDWFVNLDVGDYPLITQDDFLHILSFMPRDFNFIEHTSNIDWKERERITQVVVDPGLYLASKGTMFIGSKRRTLPTAYKFFTGSSHIILSRKLVEFSILGWDNLPRTLLLFFSNTKLSHKGYFQTLACNSKEFSNSVINSNLHLTIRDNPRENNPQNLNSSDVKKMLESGAAFAGTFAQNDPALDVIDRMVLHRKQGMVSPGGWCLGSPGIGRDPCQHWGDTDILRPGLAAEKIEKFLVKLLANSTLQPYACS